MIHAVIKTGGKQYLVHDGSVVRVEKLAQAPGDKIIFKDVLACGDAGKIMIGNPIVKGATVEAKVSSHGRHKKITGVKMKAKKRNRKYFGHKQHYTELEVIKVKTK